MSGTGFFVSGSASRYGYKLIEATCSVCGKKFLRSDQHGYCAGGKYQCSYSCYRIPDEEERRKFREKLDKSLAAIEDSDKNRKEMLKKQRRTPEHRIEVLLRRIEYCKSMISMYTDRANHNPTGSRERHNAANCASKWRRSLAAAEKEAVRLKKEMEARKNVQSTPEEKAAGGHG